MSAETATFVPVRIAVLTVSDTRDTATDTSGAALVEMLRADGHELADKRIIHDEREAIEAVLAEHIANPDVDCVLTTGGTGVTARDVTPEAVRAVADTEIDGFGELFRWLSYQKVGTSTMQSRAVGVVARGTYIFALPGSKGACKDAWTGILSSQLDARHTPCNLVELMPRLNRPEG